MSRLFISHSSSDDDFVLALHNALRDHDHDVWIDSHELAGGDPLWPEIQKGIESASAFAVVASQAAMTSTWVESELRYALELQKQRGADKYPVIPLSLDTAAMTNHFKPIFPAEPIFIAVEGAVGLDAAMPRILAALGKMLPVDMPAHPQPQAKPLEELVLRLTDLKFHESGGVRRAVARAILVYEPATPGQSPVESDQEWDFFAPLGPIEVEEIRWYLEQYAVWPSGVFKERAQRVEQRLVEWGRLLYKAAFPTDACLNVLMAWARVNDADRRFSVFVRPTKTGAPAETDSAREAATAVLALPWELLHDGKNFLFQGARPTRVRRRLPNTQSFDVPVLAPPIRILLVTARPEDDACGFIDHRASALPLVEAIEELGGLVRMTVLNPPTLPALADELARARRDKKPYHVVHFDGHGVYDKQVGLGGLCFEDPQDNSLLDRRRHKTIFTSELGPLLNNHRVPLVFLEACQTATAEKASESVASELLKVGVASVVAMSHSVLVETARRFVAAFYGALAGGARVGEAMLVGQRKLKDDSFRYHIFGAGELRLEDWFVPVLFQEKDDPQLFRQVHTPVAKTIIAKAMATRMGDLPEEPKTGFVGRSRELLALQRLLQDKRWAVVRGQGGEGKTTLAAEFARWMLASHQLRRCAFVSVENLSDAGGVLDAIGHQLLGDKYSVAAFESLEKALQPIERALKEHSTLLIVDNMESILEPPYVQTPQALSEESQQKLAEILALCARLVQVGETRLIFTSREPLPEPFADDRHRRELHQLAREDAVKLVERALNLDGRSSAASDATRESIEALVDAVNRHARTLALLAPSLRSAGVEKTRDTLTQLMTEMDRKFPGSREKSLFASVELSLRRMSPENRAKARVLGVFHGAVDLDVLRAMMQWKNEEIAPLARELIETGLASPNRYNHLTLNPALCPYLRGQMDAAERDALQKRWEQAMVPYVKFLDRQRSQDIGLAATLTVLELPNLFALLDRVNAAGNAEVTVDLTTSLFRLLQSLGKPRLLKRVAEVREAAAAAIGQTRSHARFDARRTQIEQHLAEGQLREALAGAQALLQEARAAGEDAYEGADYDLGMAFILLARVLEVTGGAEQALGLLTDAQSRFEAVGKLRESAGAKSMASKCCTERGDCLFDLGRLDEAVAAYTDGLQGAEKLGDKRAAAVVKGQIGTVRLAQGRFKDALDAYEEARTRFEEMDEPGTVAVAWHQIGRVYQDAGQPQAAENAYRQSLAIEVRLGDVAGQASTLGQLGNLYDAVLGLAEEAVAFYRQAIDMYVETRDAASEGRQRYNLANTHFKLGRLPEARQEILKAIECDRQSGHTAEPWMTWTLLCNIETAAGKPAAAAEAKQKAIAAYLAYRRDGGENHSNAGRLCLAVTEMLHAGKPAEAAELLQQLAADPDFPGPMLALIQALRAIVSGSRDRSLAAAPDLNPTMAAEILFLIEKLEKSPA